MPPRRRFRAARRLEPRFRGLFAPFGPGGAGGSGAFAGRYSIPAASNASRATAAARSLGGAMQPSGSIQLRIILASSGVTSPAATAAWSRAAASDAIALQQQVGRFFAEGLEAQVVWRHLHNARSVAFGCLVRVRPFFSLIWSLSKRRRRYTSPRGPEEPTAESAVVSAYFPPPKYAPPMESFRNGRDFAAWVGLTPRESSAGGRQRPGRITKMGQRDIRRLLALEDTSASWRPRRRRFEARPDRTGIRPPLRARSALDRTGG